MTAGRLGLSPAPAQPRAAARLASSSLPRRRWLRSQGPRSPVLLPRLPGSGLSEQSLHVTVGSLAVLGGGRGQAGGWCREGSESTAEGASGWSPPAAPSAPGEEPGASADSGWMAYGLRRPLTWPGKGGQLIQGLTFEWPRVRRLQILTMQVLLKRPRQEDRATGTGTPRGTCISQCSRAVGTRVCQLGSACAPRPRRDLLPSHGP